MLPLASHACQRVVRSPPSASRSPLISSGSARRQSVRNVELEILDPVRHNQITYAGVIPAFFMTETVASKVFFATSSADVPTGNRLRGSGLR